MLHFHQKAASGYTGNVIRQEFGRPSAMISNNGYLRHNDP
jgi:hypothetical protein